MEHFPTHPPTDQATINLLIQALDHADTVVRQEAREKLAAMGGPAVPSLVECLYDARPRVRWEAAKALEHVADPLTAPALVAVLDDTSDDVRWVAGEALVALGESAIAPVLHTVIKRASSYGTCKGAHHVLHELAKKRRVHDLLTPVLEALTSNEPGVFAPPAAFAALESWRQRSHPSTTQRSES
jgi:HEAT repeat protein